MQITSTYRLQITPSFTLHDAARVVPYLAALGVGAVYLSPILTSTTGSDHGYDCVDPTRIDPQRGGEDGWADLRDTARQHGLGVVLDIVPNHLGVARPWENPSWWSVLAEGQGSPYASWYDIDWSRGPITLGVLPEDGDLSALELSPDAAELRFYDLRWPVAPGTAAPGDDPRAVHDRQHYRLVPWTSIATDLTYRRFFTVDSLAGLRVDDPEVFAATHERVLRLVHEDGLLGLRIDHPDGLADPGGYLRRLRDAVGPDVWIVAEKILEPGEQLPDWPIAGTTGYDAMTEVCQLFVDPAATDAVTVGYQQRSGDRLSVQEQCLRGKREQLAGPFRAEIARIVRCLPDAPGRADEAVAELAAQLPVYRTYLPAGVALLHEAAHAAAEARPELADAVAALLPILGGPAQQAAVRFQQLSGAAMAKGVEDTAYYRANRFVALNEVGGDPARFGWEPEAFHAAMSDRLARWPAAMTSLSTHDTKRSEDIRARLAVLSERTDLLAEFTTLLADTVDIPDGSLRELLAQTLLATGPIDPQRLRDYATKAMREAALGTSWTHPDAPFEDAVLAALDRCREDGDIVAAWERNYHQLDRPAWSNALGQKLLQLTMPGVPDIYQGSELWDDSLVDPDNRRPVDFEARSRLLASEQVPPVDAAGAAKLWVTTHALRLRRERPELFSGYRPVLAEGRAARHLVGFDRGGVMALATRLPVGLAASAGWGTTSVQLEGTWTDVLTGASGTGTVWLSRIFGALPVALLIRG